MTTTMPQCFTCKNYGGEYRCSAFRDLIPDDILFNEFIHDKKHPDQINDLLFEELKAKGIK